MKFYNVNWSKKRSNNPDSRFPLAAVSGIPTETDVACDCGHRWHASRGSAVGQINKGLDGEVTCPNCGAVDTYAYQLPQTA